LEPLVAQHTERVQAWVGAFKDNLQKSLERALANGPKPVVIDWRSLLSKAAIALNTASPRITQRESSFESHRAVSSPNSDSVKLGAGARRVLQALKQFHPKQLSRETIIVTAGVTARSLKNYLSILRRGAYITERGEM